MADHPTPQRPNSDAGWDRHKVSRCLLPILRLADSELSGMDDGPVLQQEAVRAVAQAPETYRQLTRVWHAAEGDVYDAWFGWVACEEDLLSDAFAIIEQLLTCPQKQGDAGLSLEKDAYFAELFRVHIEGKTVDLSWPFEQYYFCDEMLCRDYQRRRLTLADQCRDMIRKYRAYYHRIRSWYRAEGERDCPISVQHHAYMALYDDLVARMAYEDRLKDDRQALEYERGGLGWFRQARKKEIRQELAKVELAELELRLEDTRERYAAAEAAYEDRRVRWEQELERCPMTAFSRRRELKQKLAALDLRLEKIREELGLEALSAEYNKKIKKRQ